MTTGIRGHKVTLRALVREDLEALRTMVNDPEVMRTSNVYRPISDLEQTAWWERALKDPHAVWFGVEHMQGARGRLVGTCCLVDIEPVGRKAELRVRIGDKGSWGKGLGSEACALLVRYGFRELNLERIWLRVLDDNERATKLYEKLGFVLEGRLRRSDFVGGAYHDMILMGLLRDEWAEGRDEPRARRKKK
jgi:RimJ/RimL family protein N-acetyltransferase